MDPSEKSAIAKAWLMRNIGKQRYLRALERRKNSFTFVNISRYENDGSSRHDPLENVTESKMLEYSELCRMVETLSDELLNTSLDLLRYINKIDNPDEQAVLIERYVNLSTWEGVAKHVSFSKAHAQRIHGRALQSMYVVLKQEGIVE